MSFWSNPFQSVSDTVSHWGDVLSSDPIAQAAVIGTAAYLSGGLSLGTTAAAADTGATVMAASTGVEGTTAAMAGGFADVTATVAPVTTAATGASLWSAAAGVGNTALAGLDATGKVLGAASVINAATGGAPKPMPAGGSAAGTVFVPATVPASPALTAAPAGSVSASGGAAAVAAKPAGLDTPTMLALLASVVTIAAFFRK